MSAFRYHFKQNPAFLSSENPLSSEWLYCAFARQDSLFQRLNRAHHSTMQMLEQEVQFKRLDFKEKMEFGGYSHVH